MRFSVILNDPRLARFASDNRAMATPAETLAAATGNIALYGTYTVGGDGQFFSQVVEGSSFPNWNGLKRGREQLTLNVDGDTMTEHFSNLPDGPPVRLYGDEWTDRRARSSIPGRQHACQFDRGASHRMNGCSDVLGGDTPLPAGARPPRVGR